MKKRKFLAFFLMLVGLVMLLAACGGDSVSDDDGNGNGNGDSDGAESGGVENARIAIGPVGSESNNLSKNVYKLLTFPVNLVRLLTPAFSRDTMSFTRSPSCRNRDVNWERSTDRDSR